MPARSPSVSFHFLPEMTKRSTDILRRLEKNMEAHPSLSEIKIEKNSFAPIQYAVSRAGTQSKPDRSIAEALANFLDSADRTQGVTQAEHPSATNEHQQDQS